VPELALNNIKVSTNMKAMYFLASNKEKKLNGNSIEFACCLNANGYVLSVDILNRGTEYWAQALTTYKL